MKGLRIKSVKSTKTDSPKQLILKSNVKRISKIIIDEEVAQLLNMTIHTNRLGSKIDLHEKSNKNVVKILIRQAD